MTCDHADLGSASDWLKQISLVARSMRCTGEQHPMRIEFIRSFFRRQEAEKPVMALRNVGCFLPLKLAIFKKTRTNRELKPRRRRGQRQKTQ